MRKIQYLRYVATMIMSCIYLCVAVTGCGIRDSAVVIPIGENETVENGTELLEEKSSERNDENAMIYVYVCGAVVHPGVYEIPEGSRVNDALQAAGGFTEDAGREYVNLAAKVADGKQLYFPTSDEVKELNDAEEAEQAGLVNINTADLAQLMTLPGIGEARAQDIIAYREEHGDFQAKEDLKNVSGIKENMYAKLCDRIIVQ